MFVCVGAWVHGRERRRYRATERDLAAQHAKMERAIARREEELAGRTKRGGEQGQTGAGFLGGRRGRRRREAGRVTRGAFEPRRPGGDDEEPERDGMEDADDEARRTEGVFDAPAAPRDSAWSLAAGANPNPNPKPPLEFGARGWDAGKTGGFTRPQWAGAAAAARRAAEGARGGLYAGGRGGGATRETTSAPPLGPSGAVPVAVTPRDRVGGGGATAVPRFGAPAGRSGDGV